MNALANLPDWWWGLLGGMLGGSLASFLAVVVERVPRGETLTGRSLCACGRVLRATENIPIIGWLAAGGRASCCGARIPAALLAGETAGVAAMALLGTLWHAAGIIAGVGVTILATLAVLGRRGRKGPRPPDTDRGRSTP